jgi:glycosyltransferase involved in cell wall biosynthesis
MKIGIDITMLVYAGSGVANYTFNLVKTLLETDKKNEYRLFYSSLRRPKNFYYLDQLKNLGGRIYTFPFPPSLLKIIWGKFNIIPIEWFTGKVDIFFFSDFLRPPLLKGTKGVTTIHDLTWKLFPQYHTKDVIEAHEKKLEKTIKGNDTIIVDSENTKNDLLKLYPQTKKNKINVIYPGIGERFRKINDKKAIEKVIKKYRIFHANTYKLQPTTYKIYPYLLYVGAIEPRKNLITAIEVFNKLIKTTPYNIQTTNLQFIITGRAGWKNEGVFRSIKELGLEDRVIFTGFVEDADLPYLYNGASLTVYLSSYEGFGLPPLESLACGTPVMAGDNSSMRETIDKKFLVDVTDKNKVLEKMKYLLSNKINIDGKEIQERFNWKESAKKFLDVIADLTD